LAVGFWKRPEDLCANWQMDKTWTPQMKPIERTRRIAGWKKAITRSFDWVESEKKG
jgi:glycerol kinase